MLFTDERQQPGWNGGGFGGGQSIFAKHHHARSLNVTMRPCVLVLVTKLEADTGINVKGSSVCKSSRSAFFFFFFILKFLAESGSDGSDSLSKSLR